MCWQIGGRKRNFGDVLVLGREKREMRRGLEEENLSSKFTYQILSPFSVCLIPFLVLMGW